MILAQKYESSDLEVLEGLDPVKVRPGMYTDTSRPNHLAYEVIDNSVDEAIEGHASSIKVILFKDGSLQVEDNGRGLPVDVHPKENISGVELVLTKLHSGGKFSGKNYKFSGGLHGVGVSVVNALSSHLEVNVKRNGQEYNMGFRHGLKVSDLEPIGKTGKTNTGTKIKFTPNPKYFDTPDFYVPDLRRTLRAKAVLCPGITIEFKDENSGSEDVWFYDQGLSEYLIEQTKKDALLIPQVPYANEAKKDNYELSIAIAWEADHEKTIHESYVNLIPTSQGGTHVNGLRSGITDAIKEFCDFQSLLPRGIKITPEDVWKDVHFVLSLKLPEPQFSGQTKERLTSRDANLIVHNLTKDFFSLWLNQNSEIAQLISGLVIDNAIIRQQKSKKVIRKRIVHNGLALPGKLSDCISEDPSISELFLVEGDSAGGSAKQARNRDTQAILPLRGKILNTWESETNEILKSQEVSNISIALGIDPGSDDISSLRYHKICILADADSDGLHIAALLCALFLKHFPLIVQEGYVYIALPPLYRIDQGKKIFYAIDEAEREQVVNNLKATKGGAKISITRFKGLGEMNPSQLRETTMNPETRKLLRLNLGPPGDANQIFDMLLSKKRSPDRKKWIEDNASVAEIV